MVSKSPFFWLHIKKCAGTSMRQALGEAYPQVDRKRPQPFISLSRPYWNDNLNNYRVPLGQYDFRRALFAKNFMYDTEEWENLFKFCVIRNPYDRIVSAFKYLIIRHKSLYPLRFLPKKVAFAIFLRRIPSVLSSVSPRHFATHVAPIMPDISNEKGENMMNYCVRLENFQSDIAIVSLKIGIQIDLPVMNKTNNRDFFEYRNFFTNESRQLFESIYNTDLNEFNYDF